MYVMADMLEPADMPEGLLDDMQRMVDKLFRDYPWLRDVLAALPKEDAAPDPGLDLEAHIQFRALRDTVNTMQIKLDRYSERLTGVEDKVTPVSAPDLEQRVKALEAALANDNKRLTVLDVWRDAHRKVQGRDLAAINRRLDALDERFTAMNALQQSTSGLVNSVATMLAAAPAPDQPLQVGDEVWVRGKLTYLDLLSTDRRPFGINFGNDDRFWFRKDTEIKRA
jgi:uncharacterized coiled-coil protein SlyX